VTLANKLVKSFFEKKKKKEAAEQFEAQVEQLADADEGTV